MRRSPAMMSSISSGSGRPSNTRSGLFVRQRLLQGANRLVEGASRLVNNALEGEDLMSPRAAKPSPYTQEKCLVFPGYAFVKNGELTVNIEGFAFGLRPLESASRTQKLFVSGARQLASLPSLPRGPAYEEPLDVELPPEELKAQVQNFNEQHKEAQAAAHTYDGAGAPSESGQHVSRLRHVRRRDTGGSIASVASTSSAATAGTFNRVPRVAYSNASLEALHENLNTRLRLFFSQKLVGRRIRVSIFLRPMKDEKEIAEKCIAKGTLVTELGGVFKSAICVPWENGEPTGRQLRVRTELLGAQMEDETIDDQDSLDRTLGRSDEASVGVTHAHVPIRVVSDIDDTIKATHVLAGIKSVFRNVFTRPHEELAVEGMQQWYWEMYEKGAAFHFVSNSPFELFGVLREYLHACGFPPGSVRLKEYGGGSGSLFGGLWEPAGERKRGGVEEILRTFPDSRFLLVGDSGEQDLELYVSLARQFPRQVLGIFIRDVTTPIPRFGNKAYSASAASVATTASSTTSGSAHATAPSGFAAEAQRRPRGPPSLQRRASDLEQKRNLEELAKEEESAISPWPADGDELDDADTFSPNNPLDRSSIDSGSLAPLDEFGYSEAERRIIALFRERVEKAKSETSKGILLKMFRSGEECVKDAEKLMQDESA